MTDRRPNRRSAMFLPALQPDRIAEVVAAGADIVVFDLEDGTAEARKDEARAVVAAAFEGALDRPLDRPLLRYLRINHPASPAGIRDLAAVLDWRSPPDGLVIPKAECAAEIAWAHQTAGAVHPGLDLMPIIETPAGLEAAPEIARAPGVAALLLGCDDLSGALGSDRGWDAMAYARGRVAAAAGAAGVEAMDGPWRDPDDPDGLIAETNRIAAMGFSGKACYHASQVPHIHAAFTPAPVAIAEAEAILAAAAADDSGLTHAGGRVVNAAVVKNARRLLALADRRGLR